MTAIMLGVGPAAPEMSPWLAALLVTGAVRLLVALINGEIG